MPQIQQGGFQFMTPAPIVYQSPIPGSDRPTIAIDTGSRTMGGGYMDELQRASRGIPVMGGRRHTTPRQRPATRTAGGEITATSRVTINKLG
jgi:hypothetical protein